MDVFFRNGKNAVLRKVNIMKREGQVRIPSGCAISAVISREGRRMTGEKIVEIAHPDGMRTCPSLFMMFTFLKTAFFPLRKKTFIFSAEGHASCQKMNVIAHQIYK